MSSVAVAAEWRGFTRRLARKSFPPMWDDHFSPGHPSAGPFRLVLARRREYPVAFFRPKIQSRIAAAVYAELLGSPT
jgi:hypothetical protein